MNATNSNSVMHVATATGSAAATVMLPSEPELLLAIVGLTNLHLRLQACATACRTIAHVLQASTPLLKRRWYQHMCARLIFTDDDHLLERHLQDSRRAEQQLQVMIRHSQPVSVTVGHVPQAGVDRCPGRRARSCSANVLGAGSCRLSAGAEIGFIHPPGISRPGCRLATVTHSTQAPIHVDRVWQAGVPMSNTWDPLHWSALAMDNRRATRIVCQQINVHEPDAQISFAQFLATLCVFDWSLASLLAVLQVFALDPSHVTDWINTESRMMYHVLDWMDNDIDVARIIELLQWFKNLGVFPRTTFPVAARTKRPELFVWLFEEYDRSVVDSVQDATLRANAGRAIVSAAIAASTGSEDEDKSVSAQLMDLVRFAFDKDLVDVQTKGHVLAEGLASECGEMRSWERLVDSTMAQGEEDIDVLLAALRYELEPKGTRLTPMLLFHSIMPPITPNLLVIDHIFDRLYVHHQLTPTTLFTKHGRDWDSRFVLRLLDIRPPAQHPWDYFACAHQVVEWICLPRKADWLSAMWRGAMLCHLLDKMIADGEGQLKEHLAQLHMDQVAVMVAVAACHLINNSTPAAHSIQDLETSSPTARTRAVLLDAWKVHASAMPAAERTFAHLLTENLCGTMRNCIRKASQESSTGMLPEATDSATAAARVAAGETSPVVGLKMLVECDVGFVAEHAVWNGKTPRWMRESVPENLIVETTENPTPAQFILGL
ncbi:hypothetical protein BCR44DRAFT_1431234 [Catenaria anguillulae PL171]|uniref:Uncharacterized protein n=1 Tax=Catenaria anguillulae PL171 TaxID=765915 RepID=A0A1Y2HTE5_9FUNG|nr:hypothetical protein BCR44DRAFT_1431234 [Catenaria anguillulae PL171]